MNMDSAFDKIRDCLVGNNTWTRRITIIDSNNNIIDLSEAFGANPVTPKYASDQPSQFWLYPQGSHYIFPHHFKGLESEGKLRAMLSSQVTCPGAQLSIRSSNTGRTSTRLAEFSLCCTHCQHIGKLKTEKEFEDEQMCQKDTIKSRLKVKKKGIKVKGVETMLSQTLQWKVRQESNKCTLSISTHKGTKKRCTETSLPSSLSTYLDSNNLEEFEENSTMPPGTRNVLSTAKKSAVCQSTSKKDANGIVNSLDKISLKTPYTFGEIVLTSTTILPRTKRTLQKLSSSH